MRCLAIAWGAGLWIAAAVVAGAGPMPTAAESGSFDAPGQLVVFEGPFEAVFEGVGTLSGSLVAGGIGVAGATFAGTLHPPLPAPPATGLTVAVANEAGFFAGAPLGTGAPLVGTMPVRGFSRLTGFGGVVLFEVPFAAPEGAGVVTAGLGVGGTIMWTPPKGDPATATFGPWSTGSVTIASVATRDGTGTMMRTGAIRVGTPTEIEFVTPVRVVSTLTTVPTGNFATLTYTLEAPEPALPALLALGSAVLTAAAHRKRR